MTTCTNSTTKVEDVAADVTKDGVDTDLEDVDEDATYKTEDATYKPEAHITATRTETVSITEWIGVRRDQSMSTKPRLRIWGEETPFVVTGSIRDKVG